MKLRIEISVGVKQSITEPQRIGGTEVEWRVRMILQSYHDSSRKYYFLETAKTRPEALYMARDLKESFVGINGDDVEIIDHTEARP